MQPTKLQVGDLMSQRSPFVVPKYQRAYAWEAEQIDDFIQDLRKCWSFRQDTGNSRDHFLGGIVSISHNVAGTKSGRQYEVIDGQQRLASFMLLFAGIKRGFELISEKAFQTRKSISDRAKSKANSIKKDYLELEDSRDEGIDSILRVSLSRADREFFQSIIRSYPSKVSKSRESHERIIFASDRIWNLLISPMVENSRAYQKRFDDLSRLLDVAANDCFIIHLVTKSPKEAYRLFQVLNDRGVGLSEGDLLRSLTLELLDTDETKAIPSIQKEVEECWDEILGGRVLIIKDFLIAYYTSKTQRRPSKHGLYDDFCDEFIEFRDREPTTAEIASIKSLVTDLRDEIEIYHNIIEGNWPYNPGNRKIYEWDTKRLRILIKSLKHTLILPLLLAAVKLDEEIFSELIQLTERFVFRYITVCKRHPGPLAEIYYKHAVSIRNSPSAFKLTQLQSDLRILQDSRADDDLFLVTLPIRIKYNEKGGNGELLYFLVTIEYYYRWAKKNQRGNPKCLDKGITYNIRNNNIEHIYARNPKVKITAMEERKNEIGNLSFWSQDDNQKAGNKDFVDKKDLYKESKVSLTKELSLKKSWTVTHIEDRKKLFLTNASRIFSM